MNSSSFLQLWIRANMVCSDAEVRRPKREDSAHFWENWELICLQSHSSFLYLPKMFPWKGGDCSDGGIRGSSGVFAGNSANGRGYWRPPANTRDSLVASTNTKQASCPQHLMTGYFTKDITSQKLKREHLTEQVHASIAVCTPCTSEEDKWSQLTADCDWNCSWK